MRKKLVQILGIFVCLQSLYCMSVSAEVPAEPLEIIDTVEIEPNVITLLKDEVRYTANWDEKGEDDTLQITYQDAQLLLEVASAEAANQGTEGMLRVMQVVINRVNDSDFPDSIQEVVYQPGMFESVTKGIIYTVDIPAEAHQALAMLEANEDMNVEIIGFETKVNGRVLEKYFNYAFSYKDHDFYIKK